MCRTKHNSNCSTAVVRRWFGGAAHLSCSRSPLWVGSEKETSDVLDRLCPDPHERRVVLNSLKPFVPRPRGDVERVELSGRAVPHSKTIALTKASHERIDHAIDTLAAERAEEHVGDLREIDLDSLSLIVRPTEDVREVRCTFEEDLLGAAKEGLDRRVRVTGVRRMEAGRLRMAADASCYPSGDPRRGRLGVGRRPVQHKVGSLDWRKCSSRRAHIDLGIMREPKIASGIRD